MRLSDFQVGMELEERLRGRCTDLGPASSLLAHSSTMTIPVGTKDLPKPSRSARLKPTTFLLAHSTATVAIIIIFPMR
jgi:hypothetical protein